MRRIVFIADDLGIDEGANAAIFRTHTEGALHGAALMMGQPGTAAAVARAHDLPSLEVGWHLHLVDSRPLTRAEWPWGRSPAAAGMALGLSARMRRLARDEIHAQWQAFLDSGLRCRFVNAHHHLHVHPFVRDCLLEILPAAFDGWIRWGRPRFFGRGPQQCVHLLLYRALQDRVRHCWPAPVSTTLWGVDRTFAMSSVEVERVLPDLGAGVHEFLFHPRQPADADTRCLLELRRTRLTDGSRHPEQ